MLVPLDLHVLLVLLHVLTWHMQLTLPVPPVPLVIPTVLAPPILLERIVPPVLLDLPMLLVLA